MERQREGWRDRGREEGWRDRGRDGEIEQDRERRGRDSYGTRVMKEG